MLLLVVIGAAVGIACANGSCNSNMGTVVTSGVPYPQKTSSLYSGSGSGTFNYDITNATCNGTASPYATSQGYPKCTSVVPSLYQTLQQYGTNNIVAIDNNELATAEGRANLCGKQIQIYRNGVKVTGGPFVVFDGCLACVGGGRISLSLTALNAIDNYNACRDGVVSGLSWNVINDQIIPFVP